MVGGRYDNVDLANFCWYVSIFFGIDPTTEDPKILVEMIERKPISDTDVHRDSFFVMETPTKSIAWGVQIKGLYLIWNEDTVWAFYTEEIDHNWWQFLGLIMPPKIECDIPEWMIKKVSCGRCDLGRQMKTGSGYVHPENRRFNEFLAAHI